MTLRENVKIKKEHKLTLAETYVLFAISNSYESKGRCEFTQKQMSEFLDIDVKTIKRSIARLEELELIEVDRKGKHKINSYRTKCPLSKGQNVPP